jgi:hypothetical protein
MKISVFFRVSYPKRKKSTESAFKELNETRHFMTFHSAVFAV